MKAIRLKISDGTPWGGDTFILDELDVEPQIRRERDAKLTRGSHRHLTVGAEPMYVHLAITVESAE